MLLSPYIFFFIEEKLGTTLSLWKSLAPSNDLQPSARDLVPHVPCVFTPIITHLSLRARPVPRSRSASRRESYFSQRIC